MNAAMKNRMALVGLALAAGAAMAQPRVEYGVIGSVSDFPLGGPWPNLITNSVPSLAALDPVDEDRTYISASDNGYLVSPGGVQRIVKRGDQIPGLPEGTTWNVNDPIGGTWWMPLADGALAVTNLAYGHRWTMRYDGSQFSIVGYTQSAVSADMAIGEVSLDVVGVGPVGGPFVPVMPSVGHSTVVHYPIDGMPGFEFSEFLYGGMMGIRQGLGGWVFSGSRNAQTGIRGPVFIATFDGSTGRLGSSVKSGDYVADVGGTVTMGQLVSYSAIGATLEGDLTIALSVTRGSTVSKEIWRVSRSGSWRNILVFPCAVAGQPVGTVATGLTTNGDFAVNSSGQVLAHVTLSSPTPPLSSTAVVLIDGRGARCVLRNGQSYPGILGGRPLSPGEAELGEDGCVAMYGNGGVALMFYRDDVGLVEVASSLQPVANGMVVPVAPERIWKSHGRRPIGCVTDGRGSLFDREGRYRFMAYVNDGPRHSTVVYTAKLPPQCLADFDGDGFVDSFDYDAFVACFEGGACPPGKTADFDGDGFVNSFDYDGFVAAFEGGCEG